MCMWSLLHGYLNWKRVYEREIINVHGMNILKLDVMSKQQYMLEV